MLPWLYNLELVDPNVSPECSDVKVDPQQGRSREGWGSSEATEMITNNLFYITVKVRICKNFSTIGPGHIPTVISFLSGDPKYQHLNTRHT